MSFLFCTWVISMISSSSSSSSLCISVIFFVISMISLSVWSYVSAMFKTSSILSPFVLEICSFSTGTLLTSPSSLPPVHIVCSFPLGITPPVDIVSLRFSADVLGTCSHVMTVLFADIRSPSIFLSLTFCTFPSTSSVKNISDTLLDDGLFLFCPCFLTEFVLLSFLFKVSTVSL